MLLASKGGFNLSAGWEMLIENSVLQGKYQLKFVSARGVNSYYIVSAYLVVPGSFTRALFLCSATGTGRWYVNGTAGSSQTCAPGFSGATDLFIGRYTDQPAAAAGFPITRVQIWNRALSAAEAVQSTTSDPPQ